ncbi:glycosyl hydrolases family 31-domain-containing protein [Aspergillus spectabilis]
MNPSTGSSHPQRSICWGSYFFGAAVNESKGNRQIYPRYKALRVHENGNTLTADLTLAGKPCNTYGTDLKDLKLLVKYQTDEHLHVSIYDANEQVYQVSESVLPRVDSGHGHKKHSAFERRRDTFRYPCLEPHFQSQYLNLRTWLPDDPYLYGLGEHTDSLRLETNNYTSDLVESDGSTPKEASIQYAELAGLPAMQSYWAFGVCRYGYRDVYQVAEVVYNYSQAGIPLETMWTDIDYMELRRVFTLNPEKFPIERMRELIAVIVPAVSVIGKLLRQSFLIVYPDCLHPAIQEYWNGEFNKFMDADNGVDIDERYAIENDLPLAPPGVRPCSPRPLPGFPDSLQPASLKRSLRRARGDKLGLPSRDLLNPKYSIQNAAGHISMNTIQTDNVHSGEGYVEYDTHSLYGTMMSFTSCIVIQQRRPDVRPLIITRSTYAGTGAHMGHWFSGNVSTWEQYRISISQALTFASMFQTPMVGADICGSVGNTTEHLCAWWAALGAFYTFSRNHNEIAGNSQEYYLWDTVTKSAAQATNFRPVTEEGSTSVNAYFLKDIFYDWFTGATIRGQDAPITLTDIDITHIPIHIRGGKIIPVRSSGAMTTTEMLASLRHSIYLDDGDTLEQSATAEIRFEYCHGILCVKRPFTRDVPVKIESVILLGQSSSYLL